MCNECGQIKCLDRCPNNTEEEKTYCKLCDKTLEDEEAYTDGFDYVCECCFESMSPIDIAEIFNISKEVV
mgnify:CR=1 FL=1